MILLTIETNEHDEVVVKCGSDIVLYDYHLTDEGRLKLDVQVPSFIWEKWKKSMNKIMEKFTKEL